MGQKMCAVSLGRPCGQSCGLVISLVFGAALGFGMGVGGGGVGTSRLGVGVGGGCSSGSGEIGRASCREGV